MKHRIHLNVLGRDRSHHLSILRNLSLRLFKHERIRTTKVKARYLKSFAEKMITRAKKDTLANRRLIYRDLKDTLILKKLFEDIAKRYQNKKGGYTRIFKLGPRKGDGAEIVLIELVEEILTNSQEGDAKEISSTQEKRKDESSVEDPVKTSDSGDAPEPSQVKTEDKKERFKIS